MYGTFLDRLDRMMIMMIEYGGMALALLMIMANLDEV